MHFYFQHIPEVTAGYCKLYCNSMVFYCIWCMNAISGAVCCSGSSCKITRAVLDACWRITVVVLLQNSSYVGWMKLATFLHEMLWKENMTVQIFHPYPNSNANVVCFLSHNAHAAHSLMWCMIWSRPIVTSWCSIRVSDHIITQLVLHGSFKDSSFLVQKR